MYQRESWQLDGISDERLVSGLRELLATEGPIEARIVAHLAEVDARRLHLKYAPSLFAARCRAHNHLLAHQDYGAAHMQRAVATARRV